MPFDRLAVTLLASAGIFVCVLPTALHAEDAPATLTAAVDHAYRPLLARYDVPGIAVVVTINGRAYFLSYGRASREAGTPVTRDTIFELGSVSKTFTATLVGYAQMTGKLSLDDHPDKYMPALRGTPIVTRQRCSTLEPLPRAAFRCRPLMRSPAMTKWSRTCSNGNRRRP